MPWTEFRPFTELINIHPYVGVPPGLKNELRTTIGEYSGGFSTDEGLKPVSGELLDYNQNWPVALGLYWIRIKSEAAQGKTKSGYFDYIGLSANINNQKDKIRILEKEANKLENEANKLKKDTHLPWIEERINEVTGLHMGGRKATYGIFRRLQDHYLKIVRLPGRGKFPKCPARREELAQKHFNDYQEFREFFEYSGTENFDGVFDLLTEHHKLDTHEEVKDFFRNYVSLKFLNLIKGDNQEDRIEDVERVFFEADVKKGEAVALQAYDNRYKELPYLNEINEFEQYIENFLPDNENVEEQEINMQNLELIDSLIKACSDDPVQ